MSSIYRPKAPFSVLPFKAIPAVDTWLIESGIGPSPDHLKHYHQLHGVHVVDAMLDGRQYCLILRVSDDGLFVAEEFDFSSSRLLKDTDCDWVLRSEGEPEIAQVPKNKYQADALDEIDWDEQGVSFTPLKSSYILSHEDGYTPQYQKKAKALIKAEGGIWEEAVKWVNAQNPPEDY